MASASTFSKSSGPQRSPSPRSCCQSARSCVTQTPPTRLSPRLPGSTTKIGQSTRRRHENGQKSTPLRKRRSPDQPDQRVRHDILQHDHIIRCDFLLDRTFCYVNILVSDLIGVSTATKTFGPTLARLVVDRYCGPRWQSPHGTPTDWDGSIGGPARCAVGIIVWLV